MAWYSRVDSKWRDRSHPICGTGVQRNNSDGSDVQWRNYDLGVVLRGSMADFLVT